MVRGSGRNTGPSSQTAGCGSLSFTVCLTLDNCLSVLLYQRGPTVQNSKDEVIMCVRHFAVFGTYVCPLAATLLFTVNIQGGVPYRNYLNIWGEGLQ